MNKYINFRSLLPHLLVVVSFAVLSVGYMSPILNGKELRQSDPRQFYAAQQELRTYTEQTGEWVGWTNSIFGGMPTYFIGGEYTQSVFYEMQGVVYRLLSLQGTYIFLYLIGAYILLSCLGAGLLPSILGAVGYAFFSYNILIIEAGHLAKIYALAFVPLMLGGLALAFRNRPWLGAALFSLGIGLELNANHFQITYYSAFILATFGIFEIVRASKEGRINKFALGAGLCFVIGLAAAATSTSRIWTSTDHAKETNRGGTELVSDNAETKADGGLDKEYAYNFSYGKLESFTLLIPNFSGGASGGGVLDDNSEVYKTLTRIGVDGTNAVQFTQSLPTYWGGQTFSGGPSYAGAIICFLFVLGLFFADKRYRWPYLVSGAICMIISWGGNFRIVNDLLFDYLPMFNKFRALSMIMSLTQLSFVVIAALGLKHILDNKPAWNEFKKPLAISVGCTAGLALLFGLIPSSLFDMTNANDEALRSSLAQAFGDNQTAANDVYRALIDDRAALLRADAWRTVIFILLAAVVLWAFIANKVKNVTLVGGVLVALTLVDLWAVDKRYLNADDFERKPRSRDALFSPTAADQQILQDKDPHFRVLDITTPGGPFQSSIPSYYHKSVGGYHTVKLGRYAELVENQISKNNMQVLNMLNTKYFIIQGQDGQPIAQLNNQALGNAWAVSEVKMVANANEEMAALDSLNPATTAVVDRRFAEYLERVKPSGDDTAASVKLTKYLPNKLTYEFNSPNQEVVVFSENYYKGNEDWISSIDGKVTPHFRANYVLRAMVVPAGKHSIEFAFKPVTVEKGRKIDLGASIAWVLFVVVAVFMDFRNR